MKLSILAARRQLVIESIASHAERLTGEPVDLVAGIKGPDSEHRQLHMLERVDEFLHKVGTENMDSGYALEEILAIDGLSKTSVKAIEAAFGEDDEKGN